MATVAEQNAAFDVLYAKLHQMVNEQVPFLFRSQVMGFLDSVHGRQALVEGIREGLKAAEKARAG